jgi:hypothetical protein
MMLECSRKRLRDPVLLAQPIVDIATGEVEDETGLAGKNPAAVALGRLKGGKARVAAQSGKSRAEIARRAAEARWKNDR